jgi:hypothetical protein
MVVKPKDQQVKMTAGHQSRETHRGSGTGAGGKRWSPLLVARLDGLGFFLAVAFRIPARFLPRSLHSAKGQFTSPRSLGLWEESLAARN